MNRDEIDWKIRIKWEHIWEEIDEEKVDDLEIRDTEKLIYICWNISRFDHHNISRLILKT